MVARCIDDLNCCWWGYGYRNTGTLSLVEGMVIALVMLNAIDGVLTIVWIETGRFTEANPLMDLLLTTILYSSYRSKCYWSVLVFCCYGVAGTGLAVISIFFCFTAYCYVLTFHFDAFNRLLLTG